MQRYTNVVNLSKFGKRKVIPEIESTSSVQLNSIQVTSINGVSIKETEQLNTQQTIDIDTSKQDIATLHNKVLLLEGFVYDLQRIIGSLTNRSF